jgi:HD-GYP domain-containing protein (c-di-GMP phosphodiesterase class II)
MPRGVRGRVDARAQITSSTSHYGSPFDHPTTYAQLVGDDGDQGGVRLAELVAALSLGIDLGFGQPMEHVLRQCLIALRLAEQVGVDEDDRVAVYYTALLVNVGCHTDAHEQAKWLGDDIAMKSDKYSYPMHGLRGAAAGLRRLGSGTDHNMIDRLRVGLEFAVSGHRDLSGMIAHHSVMARKLGEELDLSDDTLAALDASYEQWDGKGWPGALTGEDVPIAARLATVGEFTEVAHRIGGVGSARALVRQRRGRQFDPHLADEFDAHAEILLSGLDTADTWEAVIGAEPALAVVLSGAQFDAALLAVADFIDLKSPYSLGHARAVADLAAEAAEQFGLSSVDVAAVRRAGLVHCFGKLGVSNAILDKRTPLGAGERERIRMVPYLTERMLRQSPALAPLGAIAVQNRERLDGSGYPRGLSGAAISRSGRVLGAADAYRSMREPRAHREPRSAEQAATRLRQEVSAGRLDADAVEAVLGAAGHRTSRRRLGPAGLTAREIDVLRLLARGLTNKDIAARLVISPKTVANHVEHIYTKVGASTRTAAALFATQHGLLGEEDPVPV